MSDPIFHGVVSQVVPGSFEAFIYDPDSGYPIGWMEAGGKAAREAQATGLLVPGRTFKALPNGIEWDPVEVWTEDELAAIRAEAVRMEEAMGQSVPEYRGLEAGA